MVEDGYWMVSWMVEDGYWIVGGWLWMVIGWFVGWFVGWLLDVFWMVVDGYWTLPSEEANATLGHHADRRSWTPTGQPPRSEEEGGGRREEGGQGSGMGRGG